MFKRNAASVCDNLQQLLVPRKYNVHGAILEVIFDRVLMQLVDVVGEQLKELTFIYFNVKLMKCFLVHGLLLAYFAL
jgi:hypothetical protein